MDASIDYNNLDKTLECNNAVSSVTPVFSDNEDFLS
jgi:hypothetical protein